MTMRWRGGGDGDGGSLHENEIGRAASRSARGSRRRSWGRRWHPAAATGRGDYRGSTSKKMASPWKKASNKLKRNNSDFSSKFGTKTLKIRSFRQAPPLIQRITRPTNPKSKLSNSRTISTEFLTDSGSESSTSETDARIGWRSVAAAAAEEETDLIRGFAERN